MPGKHKELEDYQGYFNGPKSKPMTTELPEGPKGKLIDEAGNQWDYEKLATYFKSEGDKREDVYTLKPHIERHPLFIDLAGNPVYEGDVIYSYNKEMGITAIGTADREEEDWNECETYSPSFKLESDCEKWVNSNVKTMTLLEALEMARKIMHEQGHPRLYIHNELKFKCLLP